MIEIINKNLIIKTLKTFLEKKNQIVYVVGGFVRDCLLGNESCDIDIVTTKGHAKTLALNFSDEINGYFVELDKENSIYRVVFPDKENYIDIADCVGNSIEEDLKRRDFTINAMAYDLTNDKLIDILDSSNDLTKGIIREISKENMFDDSIRLFRAFRFQSTLGFEFSESLKNIINENAKLLQKTAKERINAELIKLFGGKNIIKAIHALDEYKILELLIPEISEIKKIPPNSHHHLPLLEHSIETVNQIQKFYELSCAQVKTHLDKTLYGGQPRLNYLKLAAFLHDVGKPYTWQIEKETGRHRFIKHDSEGAQIIVPTLKELKFSKKQIAYIQKIIKYHIYPSSVVCTEGTSEKSYLRFFRKAGEETIDLIAIAYADRMSALGPEITQEILNKNIAGLQNLIKIYFEEKNKLAPLPKLVDGNEIMQILNIQASPRLGEIIEQLKEAQISSIVKTKEEAIDFIKKINQNIQ